MNFDDLDDFTKARITANMKDLGVDLLDFEDVGSGYFRTQMPENAFMYLPFVSLNCHLKEKGTERFALLLTEQEAIKLAAQLVQRVSEIREKNNGLT